MRSYCTVVVALVLLQGTHWRLSRTQSDFRLRVVLACDRNLVLSTGLLADHDHDHAEGNSHCPPMSNGICAETCTESSCPESQICCATGCGGTACVVPGTEVL